MIAVTMRALAPLAAAWLASVAPAQQPLLDLNPATDDPGSAPGPFVVFGGNLVFAATTAATGREPWLLGGTTGQVQLVADLIPGPSSSSPEHVVATSSALFFVADDGTGQGLYTSDGTLVGTRRLRGLACAPEAAGPQLVVVGNGVFALADDGTTGPELWWSDGTAAGTRLVVELEPGPGGCRLVGATALGSEVWFAVATPHTAPIRTLLVRSGGTAASTVVITRSDQGGPLVADRLVAAGGRVFFGGSLAGANDFELWRTDGRATGTRMVVDLDPGGSGYRGGLIPLGNRVAFRAQAGAYGHEPAISDGTATGTHLVDVNVLVGRGSSPAHLCAFGGDLALFAITSEGSGLHRIDGNQLTVTFLRELAWQDGATTQMVASGSRLFLRALEPGAEERTAAQLWTSDGTRGGTLPLRDLRRGACDPAFAHLAAFGNGVVFAADDGRLGSEPWRSDGTPQGTAPAANVHARAAVIPFGSDPGAFADSFAGTVFLADDGCSGREPWRTDGTASGTRRLADLAPGAAGAGCIPVAATTAWSLWAARRGPLPALATDYLVTDGGTAPWRLPFPLRLGPPLPDARAADGDVAVCFAAPVLAAAGDAVAGHLLLRTDGRTLQALTPLTGTPPQRLTVVGGVPFFGAAWAGNGLEPWTPRGEVLDLRPGPAGSDPGATLAVAWRGRWLFSADDGARGSELWTSDGTAAGTSLVRDLAPGAASSRPRLAAVAGDLVFFVADVPGAGAELCVTDGTPSGTRLAADVRPGAAGADPTDLVPQHGGVWFAADDGASGREPWYSDGTAAGTRRVIDLVPGSAGSEPRALVGLGARRVLFVASDPAEGDEPWSSDGTAAGTRRLAAVRPGPSGSGITGFLVRRDGRVLFAADDGLHGREPWSFDPGAVASPIGTPCGVGTTTLVADDPVLGSTTTIAGRHVVVANLGGVLALSTPVRSQLLGCPIHADPAQLAVPLAIVQSSFQLAVRIPNLPALVGTVLHAQAAVGFFVMPPGLSLSNGLALRLGR